MTALVYFVTLLVVSRAAAEIIELNCSDNATCIDNLTKEFVRNMRQQKTVKLFDYLTIEPLGRTRQERSTQGLLARFLDNHAFSFDWSDFTFRLSRPEQRKDAVELEVFEGKSAKDVMELIPKKSTSKVEESDDEKQPKRLAKRRRHRKKVLQALIPMVFGMKSAGTVMFAMAMVTALTMKAFIASKMALAVTVGMAMKRLYESYGVGVGLQNHPYLYSQYPIDFPSASSHAYSVSGVQPNYASPELYSPSAMAHAHTHEMLQQNDATASQSQQAPTLQLVNNTRASERWDGKSQLQKFLEPIVDGFKSIINPIASVFYNAIPATFRGMTSDVTKAKSQQSDEPITSASTVVEEKVKKPREILQPQPRNIAQRKMTNIRKRGLGNKPKKYTELNVDLDKLKRNKDFNDYIKTKKYRHNYPYTSYYPRVKHFTNPNDFILKPNNNRLTTYTRENYYTKNISPILFLNITPSASFNNENTSDWTPLVPSLNLTDDWDALIHNTQAIEKKNEIYKEPLKTINEYYNSENISGSYVRTKKIKVLIPVTLLNATSSITIQNSNANVSFHSPTTSNRVNENNMSLITFGQSNNIFKNTTHPQNISNIAALVRNKRKVIHLHEMNRNASSIVKSEKIKPRSFHSQSRGWFSFFDFLFSSDPVQSILKDAEKMTKKVVKNTASSVPGEAVADVGPPKYYLLTYDMVMFSLAVMEDFVNMNIAMFDHLSGSKKIKAFKKKPAHGYLHEHDDKDKNKIKNKIKKKKPIIFHRPIQILRGNHETVAPAHSSQESKNIYNRKKASLLHGSHNNTDDSGNK